jgi:hypothetical protein
MHVTVSRMYIIIISFHFTYMYMYVCMCVSFVVNEPTNRMRWIEVNQGRYRSDHLNQTRRYGIDDPPYLNGTNKWIHS